MAAPDGLQPELKTELTSVRNLMHTDTIVPPDGRPQLLTAVGQLVEKKADFGYNAGKAETDTAKYNEGVEKGKEENNQGKTVEEDTSWFKSRAFWAVVVGIGGAGLSWLITWLIERNQKRQMKEQYQQSLNAAQNGGGQ